jgi:hypothetical protein
VTNDLQRAGGNANRSLLDRPQRLGILPSYWFWKQENPPAIRWGFALLAAVTVYLTVMLADSVITAAIIPPLVLLLAQGLLEKYVRRQAMKRRALTDGASGRPG